MIELYSININDALEKYDFKNDMKYLNYFGKGRHRDYLHKEDLYRSVIAEIIVRIYLCKNYNLQYQQLDFRRNEYGKPYIFRYDYIFFNISHSKDWVVVAFSDHEVGIDIEVKKDGYVHLAKGYFTKTEQEYIYMEESIDMDTSFFKIWTMKESYVKAKGKGLLISLDSFEVKQYSASPYLWYLEDTAGGNYYFNTFTFQDEYIISVATPNKLLCRKINILGVDNLINEFHELISN